MGEKISMVKNLVKIEKIKGKRIITKNGFSIGKVDDIEVDDNNWTVKSVNVKLDDDVAKLFGVKGGMMTKSEIPIPGNLMGPIGEDSITLKEAITDINSLREQVEIHHSLR
jgi:sporulation protein YlmC with PRC-barrel domain